MPAENTLDTGPRTTVERFDRAKEILLGLTSEEVQDILLLMAMGAPMLLVNSLRDAGALVVDLDGERPPSIPEPSSAVN